MKINYITTISVIVTILIASIGVFLSVEKSNTTTPIIKHAPIKFADTLEYIQIDAEVTGTFQSVVLNYTDVHGNHHTRQMNTTDNRNYTSFIEYQDETGILFYNINVIINTKKIIITPSYNVTIMLDNGKLKSIVQRQIIDKHSNQREITLFQYSYSNNIINPTPLYENVVVGDMQSFSYTTHSLYALFYIPVLCSISPFLQFFPALPDLSFG